MKGPVVIAHVKAGCWGVALGLLTTYFAMPERSLPRHRPWVVVSHDCQYAEALLEDARTNPTILEDIVILPSDSATGATGEEACSYAASAVRGESWRFRLVPESWICDRLKEYISNFRLFAYPIWIDNGRVVWSSEDRESLLSEVGLRVSTEGGHYLVEIDPRESGKSTGVSASDSEAVHVAADKDSPGKSGPQWRGRPMGL